MILVLRPKNSLIETHLECSRRPEEVVDGVVEALLRGAVLPRADLRVEGGDVEEDGGLLEGHGPLAARHASQRVVPTKNKGKTLMYV